MPEQRESLWRSVYENALEGVLLTVPTTGEVLAANPRACALLGRTEEEICRIGREGVAVLDDAAKAFVAGRQRTGRARGVLSLRRGDGGTFRAEVSSAVFESPSGELRTSMSFRDVTSSPPRPRAAACRWSARRSVWTASSRRCWACTARWPTSAASR
jgi:PAS domain S-box-containing protein